MCAPSDKEPLCAVNDAAVAELLLSSGLWKADVVLLDAGVGVESPYSEGVCGIAGYDGMVDARPDCSDDG